MEIAELIGYLDSSDPRFKFEELEAIEKSAGFQFPEDYKIFLKISGGGGTVSPPPFEHLEFRRSRLVIEPLLFHSQNMLNSGHKGVLFIGRDVDGRFLTMDLRTDSYGQIGIVDQTFVEGIFVDTEKHVILAESFSGFLKFCHIDVRTPISSERAKGAGVWAVLHMMAYYGGSGLVWGLALRGYLPWYGLAGVLLGFLVGVLFGFITISRQQTEERVKELMFAVGAIWGNLAILAGVLGIVVWIVRLIFF
jgi:hypothetical protein